MGALLESGLVGNIGLKHLKVIKEDTVNKWDKLGFLDGLNGQLKENMAQLYENQASHLINEAATADGGGSFETVVFPIIRRVFSKLLANEIVSVQAMNLPIGKLFYFVPKIQSRVGDDHIPPFGAPGGSTDPRSGYTSTARNLYDRFYEGSVPGSINEGVDPEGLFDYSKGNFTAVTASTVAYAQLGDGTLRQMTAADLANLTGSTAKSVIIGLSGFSNAGAGKMVGPTGNEMDTEEFLSYLNVYSGATAFPFNALTQKYGKGLVEYGGFADSGTRPGGRYQNLCDADGVIYLVVDLKEPTDDSSTLDGYTGYTFPDTVTNDLSITASYRIYEELEFEDRIGEVSFDLESVTVTAIERKLRAQWSPELAQDVSAFHNIDAEAELTALLSEQVAAEIDREILRDLRKGAAWKLRWDYDGWRRLSTTSTAYNQKDWNQTLITAINQISAQIHKSTLRGGANWVVCSSEVSAIFDDLEYFHVSNAAPDQDNYNMGIERVGTLSGRYQVYRDPYFPPNMVLLGHKGNSMLDTGYVYAPYVPLQLTPTMYNPFNFTPIKGIMTRYAKKMVNNRFYGVIQVDGVRTFSLNSLR
jgi:hypothetical protein